MMRRTVSYYGNTFIITDKIQFGFGWGMSSMLQMFYQD